MSRGQCLANFVSGLLPTHLWLGLVSTGDTGQVWGTQRQGYWPRTLYSVDMGWVPGLPGFWALSRPLVQLCVAGIEVPEVIKDLCRRASYISEEKLW